MNGLMNYLKENKAAVATLAAIIATVSLAGCSLSGKQYTDFFQVQTPKGVQKSIGVPSTITLTEAPYAVEEFEQFVLRNATQFSENIAVTERNAAFVQSVITGGWSMVTQNINPQFAWLGGLATMLLGFGPGLAMKRPGQEKRVGKTVRQALLAAGVPKAQADLIAQEAKANVEQ